MTKKIIFIVAGVLGVLVLAGAAFMAVRLLSTGQMPGGWGGGPQMQIMSAGPAGAKGTYSINIEPAPELPKQAAQSTGVINALKDNSFILQGGGKVIFSKSADGAITSQSDGPSIEVVVTKDTLIYQDVTFNTHLPTSGEKIQQVVEPFIESQIEKNDVARVWGSKNGDRLVADVILITRPVMLKAGGAN